MDGSFRIQHTEPLTPIARTKKNSGDGPRKPFDPEALASEEQDESEEASKSHHDDTPVGHKPDDESGSHLDLTA